MIPVYAFHPEAEVDFTDIWSFIAADSAESADRVTDEILARLDRLGTFPHQGHRRPDLTTRPLRFVNVYDYLIAYAPDRRPVWIVAIMHGSRSPRVMAAILRGREKQL